MNPKRLLTALPLVILFGCASTKPKGDVTTESADQPLTPFSAVVIANEIADTGVDGFASEFAFEVKSVAMMGEELHLNSHTDTRHPFAVKVRIYPQTAKKLKESYGEGLLTMLKGKTIKLVGVPQRVKVIAKYDDQITDEYHYQTHIKVLTTEQISFTE